MIHSDSHTYSFVSGEGDTDNNSFLIDGNKLKINFYPDYEYKSLLNDPNNYYIRLESKDSGGNYYQEAFTLKLNNLSDTFPSDISISSNKFNETITSGSVVATLSTTDADASDTHTYTLVNGSGDTIILLFY